MNKGEVRKLQGGLVSIMLYLCTIGLLGRIIGAKGMADFAFSMELFIVLYTILIGWVPGYMSKMIRTRMVKEQYKNAEKVRKTLFVYSILIGILGAALIYVFAGYLHRHPGMPCYFSYLSLEKFSILFFLSALVAPLLGYFQGRGSSMPTLVSGIVPLVLGIPIVALLAHGRLKEGEKVSALLHNPNLAGTYGSIGAVQGLILVMVLMVLLLGFLYFAVKTRGRKQKDGMRLTEDGRDILAHMFGTIFGEMFVKLSVCSTIFIGLILYYLQIMKKLKEGGELYNYLASFGNLYGVFWVIIGVEVALIVMLVIRFVGNLLNAKRREDHRMIRHQFSGILLGSYLASLFVGILNFTMATSFVHFFFGKKADEICVKMLQVGSFLPLVVVLGLVFMFLLKEQGGKKQVLLYLMVSLVGFVLVSAIGFNFTKGSVMALIYGFYVFFLLLSVLCGFSYGRIILYSPEWIRMLVMPIPVSLVVGVCTFFINKALYSATNAGVAWVLTIVAGYIIYILLMIFLRCIQEKDLDVLPFGGLKGYLGRILHIIT